MAEPTDDEKGKTEELESLVKNRLQEARRQKSHFELDMREGYFFAAPHRARTVSSQSRAPTVRTPDATLLNMSFAFELCDDFPTVIINAFFPETKPWVIRRAGPMVPEDQRDDIEEAARKSDATVFKSILASNFYEECGKAFNPDLALGTVGLWIDQPVKWKPPVVQAVPIREMEINISKDGTIGDRFIVRWTKLRNIGAVLPGKTLPEQVEEKRKRDDKKEVQIVWAFMPIYDDPGTEKWQYVLTVDGCHLENSTLKGEGSCPFLIGRFGATPEWAWAVGPLIKALPDLRCMDELTKNKTESVDLHLKPPITFPDSAFVNIQDGIETGMAYPVRPGEQDAIKNIYDPPPMDPAIYLTQDLETRLRRLFFLDWPQQDGKTPPTATQWLDEMTMAQRRIGTPGMVFWREFCGGAFMRFLYLAEKSGIVKPIKLGNGPDAKAVSLMPYNPASRAADQEEVALFARFAQLGAGIAPEEWKIETDGAATLDALAKKFGVEDIWKKRTQADKSAAIENIQKLMGGAQAGAPAMPQGAAPPQELAGPQMNQPTFAVQGQGL